MAIYDNRHWLLSHIRNSFISTDDTGMCEIVMLGEDLPKLLHLKSESERGKMELSTPSRSVEEASDDEYTREQVMEFDCYPEMDQSDEDDDPLTESYELHHNMDFGVHRQRSNTAQKLEKMEAAQRKAAKIKLIKWEDPPGGLSEAEREQLFTRKDPDAIRSQLKRAGGKSLLSEQLEKCPMLYLSKFVEFAKFDGTAQFGLPTKTYKIFMTMLPEDQRNYPITVCIVASAKILDLIGFTCYMYSIQHPELELSSVSQYGLFICEDDGEVDWYFPCIDNKEACSKFAFTSLALVDLRSQIAIKNNEAHSIPDKGGFNMIAIPDEKSVNDLSLRSRSATLDPKDQLRNRQDSVGSMLKNVGDKSSRLSGQGASVKFDESIFKVNEKLRNLNVPTINERASSKGEYSAEARLHYHSMVLRAPSYQCYKVRIIVRMVVNPPVTLGVSLQQIEIYPANTTSIFWPRIKPISYPIESIAWCEILENKSTSSKAVFKLIYSHNYTPPQNSEPSPSSGSVNHHSLHLPHLNLKHHEFECEVKLAEEIVNKINCILELQSSSCHKEYKAARERKSNVRRSFHLSRTS